MRRFAAIAKATTLEIVNEPLSLLLLSASLALAVFAPAFHYHQFGEPTRMARDAGLSALLIGGTIFSVAGTLRTFRREFSSGTAAVALSHPVSRVQFLFAKALGAYAAFALFALAVGSVAATMVNGAAIGAAVAKSTGDIPRLWGPSYAFGVAAIALPFVVGAVLNRVFRVRFPLSAFMTALAISAGSIAYRPDVRTIVRMLPAEALLWIPPAFFILAASAASVRFGPSAAAAVSAACVACFLPFAGNYCLSEALAKDGTIPSLYVFAALACALPAIAAAALAGICAMKAKDV